MLRAHTRPFTLFRSSLQKWRCFESQLKPLSDQLKAAGVDIS